MDNNDLTDLSFLEDEGRLRSLLVRANTVAQELATRRYDGYDRWEGRVTITLSHGRSFIGRIQPNPALEQYKVEVEIRAEFSLRVLKLAEAELILQHLKDMEQS